MPITDLPRPRHIDHRDALFLDFDGTLAGLASRPDAVVVAPYLPDLLAQTRRALSEALALISGRTITTIDRLTQRSVHAVAGVHGLERRTADGSLRQTSPSATPTLMAARKALSHFVQQWPDVLIEDKGSAFALHYRTDRAAKSACMETASRLVENSDGELKLIEGDCVVEVMSRGADKGRAVSAFLSEPPFLGRRPIFVGDDLTDEAAFREVIERNGIAVIVGPRRPTSARFGLASVADVHAWIGQLSPAPGAWINV